MLTRVKDGAACSGCPGPGAQGGSLLATRLPLAHPDPPFGLKAQPPLGPVPKERPEHLRQSGAHSSQCVPVPNSPCLLPVSAVKNRVLGAPWGPLIPAPLRTRPAPAGTQTRSRGVGGVPPSTPSLNLTRRSQGQLSTELTRFVPSQGWGAAFVGSAGPRTRASIWCWETRQGSKANGRGWAHPGGGMSFG